MTLQQVYDLATEHSNGQEFPSRTDLMSIAWIESTFNPLAKNGPSNGLMQVNHGSFDPDRSMAAARALLIEYYSKLKSVKATIIAYNCGIGNYLKGNYRQEYWYKYRKGKTLIESRIDAEIPVEVEIPILEGDENGLPDNGPGDSVPSSSDSGTGVQGIPSSDRI